MATNASEHNVLVETKTSFFCQYFAIPNLHMKLLNGIGEKLMLGKHLFILL